MHNINENIAAVVLAAGEGRRIGGPKAFIEIDGVSFLERIVIVLKNISCNPIVVVGGANAEAVKKSALGLGVDFALNKNWQTGQFSSLKAGLSEIKEGLKGALVALVDHPFVKMRTYQTLCEAFRKNPDTIIIPVYDHRRGHPIIIPAKIIDIVKLSSDDLNLRKIIKDHQELVVEQSVNDIGVLQDIDTISDLKDIRLK